MKTALIVISLLITGCTKQSNQEVKSSTLKSPVFRKLKTITYGSQANAGGRGTSTTVVRDSIGGKVISISYRDGSLSDTAITRFSDSLWNSLEQVVNENIPPVKKSDEEVQGCFSENVYRFSIIDDAGKPLFSHSWECGVGNSSYSAYITQVKNSINRVYHK